jgi:3-deoxy-D-manno-octulosonic acid kinase
MSWRTPIERDALADFAPLEHGGARMLVRRGYEEAAALIVDGAWDAAPVVGGGREAHPVVPLPSGEEAVVRRYRRGGLVRRVNAGRYFGGNRAFDELRATERARAGGVRTVRILAAIEHPRVFGYTAMLASLLVPGAADAAAWLADADAAGRETMLREAGREIGAMHAAGVAHPDVNLRNLLVTAPEGTTRVAVLDFDRAIVYDGAVPAGRRTTDLRRLARSVRRLRAPVDAAAWAALREGYGAAWPARLVLG